MKYEVSFPNFHPVKGASVETYPSLRRMFLILTYGVNVPMSLLYFCKKCEDFAKGHVGGAEVCMTMLFADIRGSTQLGETISPTEFREILNRFYTVATDVLTKNDAWIDKFVGEMKLLDFSFQDLLGIIIHL